MSVDSHLSSVWPCDIAPFQDMCNILLHHKCRICMCETGFYPLNSKRKGIPFRVPDIPAMPVFEYLGLWHFEGEPT